VPWPTVEHADFTRSRVDGWARDRQRVFKTMDDYRDWEAFSEASRAVKEACEVAGARVLQVRRDNAWGLLKRVFLQAGRQGRWGVSFERRGLTAVAAILTGAGFPTGKEDITYAGRRNAPLIEHCVPWVPETVALLRVILRDFSGFDFRKAFREAEPAALAAAGIVLGDGDAAPEFLTGTPPP
jgi:hypothetical protein